MDSEQLWRATLHDLNNLLGGLQGVLALEEAGGPHAHHRVRMAHALEDGRQLLALARGMAVGLEPEHAVSWEAWRAELEGRLGPLAALHHGRLEILDNGAASVPWPGPAFLNWAVACSRALLPWMSPDPLRLEARVDAQAWTLEWLGELPLPPALHPEDGPASGLSLPGLWLRERTGPLGIQVSHGPKGLLARLPRY